MSTANGKSFTSVKNLNLRGGAEGTGLLRWSPSSVFGQNSANWSTNPFGTTDYGLYINASGQLVFSSAGSLTIISAVGGPSAIPSWDAIFDGDQTLDLGGTTFTIDNSTGNNDVLTLTNTGAGSGDTLQITNVGTGKDVNGTSGTWSFSKLGAGVALTLALAGTAGATSLSLTLGNIVTSAGGLSLTKAANNATLSVTNDTATSASVFVFAGAGAFTGSTTTSFFTITPSGLQSGTAVYLPLAAVTSGKGLLIAGGTTQTSGLLFSITSAATGITTTTGALVSSIHTGNAGTSAVLNYFSSAAADETVIMQINASAALALGIALNITASSMTTGNALQIGSVDSLTTGYGIYVSSASTAITSAGHLLYVNHSGVSTSAGGGVIAQFSSAATDATTVVGITASSSVTTVGLAINDAGTGMTSGSLLRVTTATTGAVATNGIVSVRATGAYTSTSNAGLVDISATATLTGTVVHLTSTNASQTATQILNVTQSGVSTGFTGNAIQFTGASTTGTGNTLAVIGVNTTAGNTVSIANNALTVGTGTALNVSHTTSVLGAGTSLIKASSTSVDTGTTAGVLLHLATTSAAGSTQFMIADSSADTSARIGFISKITNAAAVAAVPIESSNVAVTGTGSKFTKHIVLTDGSKTTTIWLSTDATSPNTALTGTVGDICLNGPSGRSFYCTGTTNWTASNA